MFNFEFSDDFHVAGGSRAYARTVAVWSRAGEMLGRAPVASREPVGARQAGGDLEKLWGLWMFGMPGLVRDWEDRCGGHFLENNHTT